MKPGLAARRRLKSAKLGLAANEKSFLIFRLIFACAAPRNERQNSFETHQIKGKFKEKARAASKSKQFAFITFQDRNSHTDSRLIYCLQKV